MTVFEYKVDNSQTPTPAAFEQLLNLAGQDRWELVIANDSGDLIYKRSGGSSSFEYKVDATPASALVNTSDYQAYLDGFGNQGWELVATSSTMNRAIFKQEI